MPLIVAKAITHKTDPLVHDGALMLGGEQVSNKPGLLGALQQMHLMLVVLYLM